MTQPRDLPAFCEVLDTMVEWFDAAEASIDAERDALSSVRTCVALRTPATEQRVDAACALAADPSATGPRRDLLCAIFNVARAATWPTPLATGDIDAIERLLLTHAANAGKALGVKDAAVLARKALERGRSEGRQTGRFPEPGFARQLALGCLIAQYRDLGRLKQPDLVNLAAARGVKITKAQLARVEGGTCAKGAPVDALIVCLGHDPQEFRERANRAHDLARELTAKIAGRGTERWFAEFVAVFGERGARAGVALAACAAARLDAEKVRR